MKFKFETEVEITDGFYKGRRGQVAYPVPFFFLHRAYHILIDRLPGSHRDVVIMEKHLKEVTQSKSSTHRKKK